MFCKNCGKQMAEGIKFCPACGKEISLSASELKTHPQNEYYSPQQIKGIKIRRKSINYNLGHICIFIGITLEILSLFLPNKGSIAGFNVEGMTILDYLRVFLVKMAEGEISELTLRTESGSLLNIVLIYFLIVLILCFVKSSFVIVIVGLLNTVMAGTVLYQFNESAGSSLSNSVSNALSVIGNYVLPGEIPGAVIRGLGFQMCLISVIIIFISTVITAVLMRNAHQKLKQEQAMY